MVKIKIDNKTVEADEGRVLMEVIRESGVEVPSLCYLAGEELFTSCMLCVVKDRKSGKILPSCSMKVQEGMDIISLDEEIHSARKIALELLLSEHVGDCEAPCQVTCPAHMDIPRMNRLLAAGKFEEAREVVMKDIALPAVLGRICPAPCEGACRRKTIDEAVSICLLKRFAGDHDSDFSWLPSKEAEQGKTVAVIGSGPAGLAAAFHLAQRGYRVEVLDRNLNAGGSLRKEVNAEELPPAVLDGEIARMERLGVEFHLGRAVDPLSFQELVNQKDAVVVATGKGASGVGEWKLPMHARGVEADAKNYQVGERNIFVAGSALKPSKMAIRALGQGKEAAFSVDQYLQGSPVTGEPFRFNSRFGKLLPLEFTEYLKESRPGKRIEPKVKAEGLSPEQVIQEASRCLHCDCRDMEHCKLRLYADQYDADQKHFKSDERQICTKSVQHETVIYEASKCIKCGICVRLAARHKEKYGMTFIGRGFDVQVALPFNETLAEGLKKTAREVVEHCPTGALTNRD